MVKGLSAIIGTIVVLGTANVANLVFAEAFIASHLGQSTTAAMAPRSRADARIPLRGRAETARAESRSCDENSVLGTETPLEDKVAAGRRITRKGSPASTAAPLPWVIQGATALAVVFLAATTEEDIMSAMRGLDGSLTASPSPSQGQPEVTLIVPSDVDGEIRGSPQKAGVSEGDVQAEKGDGIIFQGGRGIEFRGDSELMRSLAGGPRQAGPLTHGF